MSTSTKKFGSALAFSRAELAEHGYVADELAIALQTALNNASIFGGGYTCTFDVNRQTITVVRADNGFFLVNDDLLQDLGLPDQVQPLTAGSNPYVVNFNDPQSAHQLLGLGMGLQRQHVVC